MAFYVKIEKIDETELIAKYRFGDAGEKYGEFEIDKKTGEVHLLAGLDGDRGHIFNRAAVKIMREWKLGRLPSMTEWAS
ncbi:hypothetical protein [Burkholderia sp. IMCC1007]|uniref:hypothetical protein n=1 Tax=Burkholderia sp. IMCC1007 TaxID=3004104 RepID=UPI0022B3C0FF|nr:hypothetical protein [Burkholderia sp. IMCC1007]